MRGRPLVMGPVRDHRGAIATLLLVLYLPACTSWQVGKPSPEEFVENESPESVRVTQTDGSRIELRSPEIRADSLVGTVKGDTVSIALPEIQSVEVRKTDTNETLALTLILALVTVAIVATAASGLDSGLGTDK